jgi:CBS domain-containing protein
VKIKSVFAKPVVHLGPKTTLQKVAQVMKERNVGAVVVTEQERPVGIVTDRDIALALCERGFSREEPVQQVMTTPVETLQEDEGIHDATRKMLDLGVRRLPVVNGSAHLFGLVSLDDLLLLISRELNEMAEGVLPSGKHAA